MKIIFVTGSANKYNEAKQTIPILEHHDLDLVEIQGIDPRPIIAHKLQEAKKVLQGNLVVEDTSLYFDSLMGLPGPLIKWFMKTIGNYGLYKMCQSFGTSKATAKCVIGLSREDGSVEYFEGSMEGEIVEPRGENGFGWDPIFQPAGWDKTLAEMTQEEKNEISMRMVAFQKLNDYLSQ